MRSQQALGNCFIEYIWPASGTGSPEVLERFPFWSPEPDADYFRGLAHAGIRSFYRADHPKREQINVGGNVKEVSAEAIRLVDEDGKEICRWTAEQEWEELSSPHRRQNPAVNREGSDFH
ncbi:MAG TPA: hypothetical protein VEK34_08265 [Methylocella sp.]|nr:hypothetical protein [Methylocella sp.]